MMKSKRAWLRIVEAFIAIILIAGVLIFVYSKTVYIPNRAGEIYKLEKSILEQVAGNVELRQTILEVDLIKEEDVAKAEGEIEVFVRDMIPSAFDFEVRICAVDEICNLDFYVEEVYAKERIISSTLQEYGPKKVKLFMWRP